MFARLASVLVFRQESALKVFFLFSSLSKTQQHPLPFSIAFLHISMPFLSSLVKRKSTTVERIICCFFFLLLFKTGLKWHFGHPNFENIPGGACPNLPRTKAFGLPRSFGHWKLLQFRPRYAPTTPIDRVSPNCGTKSYIPQATQLKNLTKLKGF